MFASAVSLMLHIAILLGIPVSPPGGSPLTGSIITARLENPGSDVPEKAASDVAPPDAAVVEKPAEPARVDALAPQVNTKPEPKPESKPEPKSVSPPEPAALTAPISGIELPLIRDPTFYPASQLDVYPQPVAPIQLSYPDSAAAERVEGNLLLLLLIDEYGVVSEVSIIEATPAGYFEDAARATFRNARFFPGMRHGHPVKSRMPFRIRYTYDKSAGPSR